MGGNLINFPGEVTAPTADLVMAKLIFNSVLSTKNAKFMCADITNFYLKNPMNRYEYMKPPMFIIPEEIIQQYKLVNLAHKGFCIYGNPKRHVWATPGREHCK